MADKRTSKTFGLLDIGTSKTVAAVIVAEQRPGSAEPVLKLAGLGMQRSKGVKAGVLTNLDDAESIVRSVIGHAERTAGVSVGNYTVSIAAGRLASTHCTARIDVESGHVTHEDMARLMSAGESYAQRDGRTLLHLNRLACELDGAAGVRDPIGFAARRLAAGLHAVTADEAPLRNLLVLIDRCYAECDGLVATPYASALAVTTPEERQFGVTCIDFGAGTTTLAMFSEGMLAGVDVVPVGGQHITYDIARTLQTPLSEAERIKTLYGTLLNAQSDEHESIAHPVAGEDDDASYETTKARLTEIIRPRVQQLLGLVGERIALNPASRFAGEKVVLTGGASQLLGLSEYVAHEFGRPVRLGRPNDLVGLNASLSGPQMATISGLATIAARGRAEWSPPYGRKVLTQGYLGRVGSWLKRGF
ncbi:cell division protein FtsA [Hyphomicrobium methylovorum]|uniref:cell division protein FtsA n=1 Tax=Hyphomicrobium methylovorum TaxID=84 RepID=UPI0015E7A3ED|nr:cell division protein FtsA [Hyphomicrobium methylovorum]MBA2126565.1 cell division protein FtsA [Hyphomicrobium methylovorum]